MRNLRPSRDIKFVIFLCCGSTCVSLKGTFLINILIITELLKFSLGPLILSIVFTCIQLKCFSLKFLKCIVFKPFLQFISINKYTCRWEMRNLLTPNKTPQLAHPLGPWFWGYYCISVHSLPYSIKAPWGNCCCVALYEENKLHWKLQFCCLVWPLGWALKALLLLWYPNIIYSF